MKQLGVEADLISVAALGDPVRRALYQYVLGQPGAVSRDQAAEGVGVARHVAKFQLDKLEQQGLLEAEFHRPDGRGGPGAGRPTKYYRRSAREIAISLPERHYAIAGQLMAAAITESQREGIPVVTALRTAARALGSRLATQVRARAGARPSRAKLVHAVVDVLSSQGYEPTRDAGGLVLGNCPFHALAEEYTDLVCGMNRDLCEGLLETLPGTFQARLDPAPGRCCVRLVPME